MKFLVADDHHLIREGLRYALEGAYDDLLIVEAMDGRQVLEAVAGHADLDLILLDYFMPDTDGFSLVSELCERHPGIPVIILSGSDDPSLMHKLLERGAAGFLPKTTDHEVIMKALELVLAGGIYMPPDLSPPYRRPAREDAREALDDAVSPEVADPEGPPTAPQVLTQLTQRQQQVLRLVAEGLTNKDISRELQVSENTVKVHVTAILKALNVSNRTQAVLVAQRLGIPEGP